MPASPHFVRLARTATLANPPDLLGPAMPVQCEARAERAPRRGERRAKRAVNERSEATSEPERDSNHARRAEGDASGASVSDSRAVPPRDERVSPRVRIPRDAAGVSRLSRSRWLRSVPPCPLRLTSFGSHARRPFTLGAEPTTMERPSLDDVRAMAGRRVRLVVLKPREPASGGYRRGRRRRGHARGRRQRREWERPLRAGPVGGARARRRPAGLPRGRRAGGASETSGRTRRGELTGTVDSYCRL